MTPQESAFLAAQRADLLRFAARAVRLLRLAEHGVRSLNDVFRDRWHGGWYSSVGGGSPRDAPTGTPSRRTWPPET
ncbi:hypothetical protein Q6348_08700 [Isoptericola sp. b441]|uniref:Uncharacterized protein n=1 Tax=Actinotalea lenta TaxID=3064654 RepID=A0ABT9DAU6_9CELL|nr:hypothetical protein [Isoptericola sp. b441]MDO8107273.1 hypothetical protein [Isoptericola sp. b441]